jgi:hypothetical protein
VIYPKILQETLSVFPIDQPAIIDQRFKLLAMEEVKLYCRMRGKELRMTTSEVEKQMKSRTINHGSRMNDDEEKEEEVRNPNLQRS